MDKKEMMRQLERIRKEFLKRLLKRADGERQTLVYGLCAEQGIDTQGMSPKEAWQALSKATGKTPEEILEKHDKPKRTKRKLSKKEYAHVCSEISTWYHKRFSGYIGKTCGISIGNKFYVFNNHEFGNYEITRSIPINGNEEYINDFMEMQHERSQ